MAKLYLILASLCMLIGSCQPNKGVPAGTADTLVHIDTFNAITPVDSLPIQSLVTDSVSKDGTINNDTAYIPPSKDVNTKNVQPGEVLQLAKTLVGVPYQYASSDPKKGFDCSGFITYVFNRFGISVPRSSIDFTNVGTEVSPDNARPGDLILFTGTNPLERFVGHMGIITENKDSLRFIHSSSGKANGVTITPLNDYYKSRYVKIVRIFP
jgi:cell wall-associated NlpC family hydrolase